MRFKIYLLFVTTLMVSSLALAMDSTSNFSTQQPQRTEAGPTINGSHWEFHSKTANQNIVGEELSCEGGESGISLCGGCNPSGSNKGGKGSGGIKVSKGFAESLRKGLPNCIALACGGEVANISASAGAKVYGCGFQDRKTAGGKVSNHAGANAIDLNKIECPGGAVIDFNLSKQGSQSLAKAIKSNVKAKSTKGKRGIRSCSHSHPSSSYEAFNKCWSAHLKNHCEPGKGGLLSATKSNAHPPAAKPDTKRCHHNDHVHFSSCPGSGT